MKNFLLVVALLSLCGFQALQAKPADPLSAEIARWKNYMQTHPPMDEDSKSTREMVEPVFKKAEDAIVANRPLLALHYLSAVRFILAGERYQHQFPASTREQISSLEKEWKKTGGELRPVLEGKERPQLSSASAAVRAIGEASFSEIKPYYESSLEYGKNTVADAGLFYLGSALAQHDFVRFCSELSIPSRGKSPKIQNLPAELEEFENELLAAYKPPASVDQHPLFIRTSGLLKEARELQDAGLESGALYVYLNARLRFTKIGSQQLTINAEEASRRATEVEAKLNQDSTDHSIARLFLEMALAESSDPTPGSTGGATARAIFNDVLPHYFASLQPPKPQPPKPTPVVTVTLVRWPYT